MKDTSAKKILIIQTAFIGDSILASSFAYEVKKNYPNAAIHFLIRKGNESLSQGLDFIDHVWIWDKNLGKFKNLFKIGRELKKEKFDLCFNLHRHATSGFLTWFSGAQIKVGFSENPLSILYDFKLKHQIPHLQDGVVWHEVQRNAELLTLLLPNYKVPQDSKLLKPHLPIKSAHLDKVKPYENEPYVVMAPASVWMTKQWPLENYEKLVSEIHEKIQVYLIGAPGDFLMCEKIKNDKTRVTNLCGKLSLLESAALMKNAKRVIVNDSAPLHLASSVDAKVTSIFCSTIKEFGYFPLSSDSIILEVEETLSCRPCGLHGKKSCPLTHFQCGFGVSVDRVVKSINL